MTSRKRYGPDLDVETGESKVRMGPNCFCATGIAALLQTFANPNRWDVKRIIFESLGKGYMKTLRAEDVAVTPPKVEEVDKKVHGART